MAREWPKEVKDLYRQYQAREEAIKKAWCKEHPEKMIRGTVAGAQRKALWEAFAAEAREIEARHREKTNEPPK